MAKAPQAGRCKTRLTPFLTPEQAATLSVAFLRDMTENVAQAARSAPITPYIAYAPAGAASLFGGMAAPGTAFVLADGIGALGDAPGVTGFGRCLLHAVRALLAAGHKAVCVLNSDSPSLPTSCLTEAAHFLASGAPGVVIGGAEDGGYYLLGMRRAEAALFADILWSTERVFEQTLAQARDHGLDVHRLPVWYDVDDKASLLRLLDEFAAGAAAAYPAHATRACARDFPFLQTA